MALLHGAGEDVVTAEHGGADKRLGTGGWGSAGDEPGQPFPADGFGGPPGLVVVDHPSPLDPLRLPDRLISRFLTTGWAGGGWVVGVAGVLRTFGTIGRA